MRKLLGIILLSSSVVYADSPSPGLYVRVLLPLYLEHSVPGAFGSLWESRFAVHNNSGVGYIFQTCSPLDPSAGDPGCLLILNSDEDLLPGATQTVLPARYPKPQNGAAGAVIYFIRDPASAPEDPNGLSFELRIADTSRDATSAGTEVPVVRESAFRLSTLHLLDIPIDARFRLALRLFEMNLDQAEFVIRVFDRDTNELLSEQHVTTFAPHQTLLRFRPGFLQIMDLGLTADATNTPDVRIEIEPLTTGAAFWAYVSVTNNDSQQITLITPQ